MTYDFSPFPPGKPLTFDEFCGLANLTTDQAHQEISKGKLRSCEIDGAIAIPFAEARRYIDALSLFTLTLEEDGFYHWHEPKSACGSD